jgi:hypothetical protein
MALALFSALGTCEQKLLGLFECSDGRFARNAKKSHQKVFEGFSTLKVVEQRLDRHSRSAKHRSSAENVRIPNDNSHETHYITPGMPLPVGFV